MTHHDPRQCDLLALLDRPAPVGPSSASAPAASAPPKPGDFAALYGNEIAKRALEIALVGGHSIALVGVPGSGKADLVAAARKIGWLDAFSASVGGGAAMDLNVECSPPRDCDRCLEQDDSAAIAGRVTAAKRVRSDTLGLEEPARKLMVDAVAAMRLDERAQSRVLKVALSIKALAGGEGALGRIHIAEALSYARPIAPAEPDPQPVPVPSVADTYFQNISRGREVVEIDPKRLAYDGGDISRSYSAQSLSDKDGSIKSPFRFRGGEWVSTSGGGSYCVCYRVVALDAFDGPTAPYREHGFLAGEEREQFGGYHGMSAKHGSREVVLEGPPLIFVAGKPDQAGLL